MNSTACYGKQRAEVAHFMRWGADVGMHGRLSAVCRYTALTTGGRLSASGTASYSQYATAWPLALCSGGLPLAPVAVRLFRVAPRRHESPRVTRGPRCTGSPAREGGVPRVGAPPTPTAPRAGPDA